MKNRCKATLFLTTSLFSSILADEIKPNGCKGPSLCTSYPILESCRWQFDAGLLYQQMRVSGAEVAIASIITEPFIIPTDAQEFVNYSNTNIRFQFDINAGLKLGAGYYFPNDDFLLSANFEWLSSTANVLKDADVTIHYHPSEYLTVWAGSEEVHPLALQEIDANFEVDYFLLDIVLAKGSYFSELFTLEPFSGIQSTWIGYNTEKRLFNDSHGSSIFTPSHSWVSLTQIHFWGVGPEIGLNSSYYIFGGWSIYSTLNAAVLFGQTTFNYQNGVVTHLVVPTYNEAHDQNNVVCPTTRAILGLQYDKNTYCDKQHLRIRAGFDARYIFNQYPTIEYEVQLLSDNQVQSAATDYIFRAMHTKPNFVENSSFAMVGLILDFAYDF